MQRSVLRGACLVLVMVGAGVAHAGLFDDEEARKAIVDLRNRIAAMDEQGKARVAEIATLNGQLSEQLTATRRSLLDLNNQIEALRAELARLRGTDEQLSRDLAEVQRRQKDVGQALDERLRKLEPERLTLDGREISVDPAEKRAHDEAMATVRSGDFERAAALLATFQRRYPASPFLDSVRFWQGNALYGKRDYKEAIAVFRAFVASSPDHPRAPEALLALANSQAEMKDPRAARKTIDELLKAYPKSEAAQAGKERLAAIK